MAGNCCESACGSTKALDDKRWRGALWIALAVNAGMFAVEMAAGAAAGSRSLMADALDFFGDAANYAISLAVAGAVLTVRARAALFKGATLLVLGVWVLLSTAYAAFAGALPHAETMGIIGTMALVANLGVALLLYRFRAGDANMRSVWICSRNDAIGNVAVVAAAFGVFGTGTAWPDLIVAAVLALLGISGGVQIIRQARSELRTERSSAVQAAGSSPVRVKLTTDLDVPAERAWAEVRTSRLLDHVAAPLQAFEPVEPPVLPDVWQEGRYLVRLRMFGVLPIGMQWIVISFPDASPERYQLRDNGHGSLVSTWDHLITIEPLAADRCRYTDEVEVRAGLLTPFVWAFARLFYAHRQRRWRRLVATRFADLKAGVAA